MTRKLLIMICLLGFSQAILAQKKGSVTVHANSQIDQLMDKYNQITSQNPGMDGYRILIYSKSGNDSKMLAMSEKARFESKFPDIAAYLVFDSPDYKIRVGNFRTRLDAEACHSKIVSTFSGAFIVPDFIELPKIDNEITGNESETNK